MYSRYKKKKKMEYRTESYKQADLLSICLNILAELISVGKKITFEYVALLK